MTLFGVSFLVMISHRRIPLSKRKEELTGICVFRSCHTLFNFQGPLDIRRLAKSLK